MIINEWESAFTANYGHTFPDTYLCLDTEYTGGDERTDFVMEIGHVMVRDRQVVDRLNIVLDWSVHPGVDNELLRYKLKNIQSIMGDDWRITWDVMREEGIAPYKAIKFYYRFFKKWNEQSLPYVAHNGRVAEERMLRGLFNRYLDKSFVIGDNQLWDTGAIFKATRLFESIDSGHANHRWKSFPQASDSMKDYFDRVLHARLKGLYWKLKLCLEHYGLTDNLTDDHRYHQAVHDAYCSHLLMEAFRGELGTASLSDVVEEHIAAVPELKEVPSQPLESSAREELRDIEVPTLPAPPKFKAPEKEIQMVIVEDLDEETKKEVMKNGWREEVTEDSQEVEAAEEVEVPPPSKESEPRHQPLRGRKRGQRVI